ncbi:MAG: adenylosuccinate lyase, partial [Defluviitaleaceae bacterium]|nr:adenylosuccinate lyase [Defluviitaleaceae bacterium]
EPFEKNQIGSSAMAYKRNPMRAERMNALARHIISQASNTAHTASAQWLERTLDDSANKRIAVPEAFLALDGLLNIFINVTGGLVVYPKMIHRRVMSELPFMATENIMMDGVKRGGDRQQLHEAVRVHSMAAAAQVKEQGADNDLLARIADDPLFDTTLEHLEGLLSPKKFTGRAAEQTEEFLEQHVRPMLEKYEIGEKIAEELKV